MRAKKTASRNARPSLEEDIRVINALEHHQLWFYLLASSAPLGSYELAEETVRSKLGLSEEEATGVRNAIGWATHQLLYRESSPASAVAWLVQKGLEIERANMVVDAGSALATYLRDATLASLTGLQKLSSLEERMQAIEKSVKSLHEVRD